MVVLGGTTTRTVQGLAASSPTRVMVGVVIAAVAAARMVGSTFQGGNAILDIHHDGVVVYSTVRNSLISNRPTHTQNHTERDEGFPSTDRPCGMPATKERCSRFHGNSLVLVVFIYFFGDPPTFFANQVLLFFVLPFTTRSTWRGFANRERERERAATTYIDTIGWDQCDMDAEGLCRLS